MSERTRRSPPASPRTGAHAPPARPGCTHDRALRRKADLDERWRELCARYLPLAEAGSIWRLSRAPAARDPAQGWKLHVSANVLTAYAVLGRVAPLLDGRGTRFKAPVSLDEVQRINSGLYYGYSQVGKIITVYPETAEESVELAQRLDEALGRRDAPAVPFDRRYSPGSSVYYRYGAFRRLEIENRDGTRTPAIRDPAGRLIPDLRDAATAQPAWVVNPFPEPPPEAHAVTGDSPLRTTYRAFRALSQRGRGGVYEAVDASAAAPRLCILKEGRRGGELTWDERDGAWRVRQEERVLGALGAAGVEVPRVYASFIVDGNYYLVTEFIAGETLHAHLLRRRRRLSLARALRLAADIAHLLARIHAAGWSWRDCKPSNLMLTKAGRLRPFDFEGACPVAEPDPVPWGTAGFTPPERPRGPASSLAEDLYALGATLHLLLMGELPNASAPPAVSRRRRRVPPPLNRLISDLLTADARRQPAAHDVADALGRAHLGRPVNGRAER